MQFNVIDGDGTIEVSENGVIGYITFITKEIGEDGENILPHRDIFFDFKAGVNPSLSLEEMKEIVDHMESLK